MISRRVAVLGGLSVGGMAAPAQASALPLVLAGRMVQGGALIGRTAPRAEVSLDGDIVTRAGPNGLFLLGFDRDAAATSELVLRADSGAKVTRQLTIARGQFDVQRINGLPGDRVTPSDPKTLDKIRKQVAQKNIGLSSRVDGEWFGDGFREPLASYRLSGKFGGQRILNGVPARPHYGQDMAAPAGTRVLAPCAGRVSLAGAGFHYEGGLVMIDHGQGLVTMYLHMRKVDVAVGQLVTAGQVLGEVGMEGRATGPHLCWRMSWRRRHLSPGLLVGLKAPAFSAG